MHLTNITLENLRGFTRNLELGLLTIITGLNGSGKTSVLDAIELLIEGHVYRLGLKTDSLLPLFPSGTMAVSGSTEDLSVTRTWKRKSARGSGGSGTAGVSIEQGIRLSPGDGAKKLADQEATIRQKMGSCSMALDLSELLGETAGAQRKLLFGFADLSTLGWTRNSVLRGLRAKVLTADVECDTARNASTMFWLNKLVDVWGAAGDVEEGLSRLATYVEDQRKIQKAIVDEAEKASRAIAPAGAAGVMGAVITERTVADAQAEVDRLTATQGELQADLAVAEERAGAAEKRETDLTRVRRAIETLAMPAAGEDAEPFRADIARLERELTGLPPADADMLGQAQVIADDTSTAAGEALAAARTLEREKSLLVAKAAQVNKMAAKTCPTCAHTMTAEEAAELLNRLDTELSSVADQLTAASAANESAAKASTTAKIHLSELRIISDKRSALATRLRDLERNVQATSTARAAREDRLAAERARLERMESEDFIAPAVADHDALIARADELNRQVSLAKEKVAALHKQVAAAGIQKEQANRKYQAEISLGVLEALKKAVGPNGLQGDVVKSLALPITEAANALLRKVNVSYGFGIRMVDERGADCFSMGWERPDGVFISWPNLSNGQRAIWGAALAIALLDLTKPPLKLLKVDNLEALDEGHAHQLLDALTKFAGGVQVIVAGVHIPSRLKGEVEHWRGLGWTVHQIIAPTASSQLEVAK